MKKSKFKTRVKHIGKKILLRSAYSSGLSNKFIARKANKEKLILTYHNILPEVEITHHYTNNVDITTSAFEFQIKTLKNLFGIQPAGKLNDPDKNGIFISFDDGMLNNIEIAEPILSKYGVTAMFGICSGLVDGTVNFIWRDFLYLILKKLEGKKIMLADISTFSGDEVTQGNLDSIARAITVHIENNVHMDHAYKYLSDVAKDNNVALQRKYVPQLRYTPMGIADIHNLNNKGHLIASHTHSHRKLSLLSESELDQEMKISRNFLIDTIGSCDTLVYPYGSDKEVNEIVGRAAEKWNYEFAYMNIPTGNLNGNFFIPRLNMRNVSTKSEFLGLLAGINKIF